MGWKRKKCEWWIETKELERKQFKEQNHNECDLPNVLAYKYVYIHIFIYAHTYTISILNMYIKFGV